MLRSVGVLSLMAILQLLTQFALQCILADRFGASAVVDAFNAALALPSALNTMLSVTLGFVLIPTLSNVFRPDRDASNAWQLAISVGVWVAMLTGAISTTLSLFSYPITDFFYGGFEGDTMSLSANCLRSLAWQLFLGAIVAWLTAVHNARLTFAWPALTALLGAGINLILAQWWMQSGIEGYVWSILVSGIVQVALLMAPIGLTMVQHLRWTHPELWPMAMRWLPLLVGGIYIRLDPILDRYLGSFLEVGSIAYLGYAQRFIYAILAIATGGLMTVLLPNLSPSATENLAGGLGERLRRGLHGLTLIVIPIAIGGCMFAEWSTRDLLERGVFRPEDTLRVAELFRILLVMFLCASLGDLISRGFYAIGDTRTPTVVAAIGVTLTAIGKWFLVTRFGVQVLAWGTSIYFGLVLIAMSALLSRQVPGLFDRRWLVMVCKSGLASLGACAVAYGIAASIGRYGTWVAAPVAVVVYGVCLWGVGERLMLEMWERATKRSASS